MEWSDDGIVLGVRRHGESSAIVELLTRAHGRHLGLVRGGASARMRPVVPPGNSGHAVLRERDPHEDIYEMLERTLDDFDDAGEAAVHLVRFELAMLAELGFGLDLDNCAATGETSDLAYVSPKSGGAGSR